MFVKNLPKAAPKRKDNIIIKYFIKTFFLELSFFKTYSEKLAIADLKFPVHIVVEYTLPFKLLKTLVCKEQTKEITTITRVLLQSLGIHPIKNSNMNSINKVI